MPFSRLRPVAARRAALLLLAPALGLAACATPRAGDYDFAQTDPWEKTNRRIFALNNGIDRYALRPAANVYRAVVPKPARTGVHNALSNYNEPLNFTNAVLQGKISRAFRTLDRFLVNSTVGVGGLIDVATDIGRPELSEDYGQTFAVWGFPSGPFLMLPVFGPSTVRDGVGTAGNLFANPADITRGIVANPSTFWRLAQTTTQIVDLRSRVTEQGADQMMADSLDAYTLVKSAYLQRRLSEIWDGNPPMKDDDFLDEPLDDPLAEPGAAPAEPAPESLADKSGDIAAIAPPPQTPAAPEAPSPQTPAPVPAEPLQD
jgi:phospholipid-binding lipoprotein MlaA